MFGPRMFSPRTQLVFAFVFVIAHLHWCWLDHDNESLIHRVDFFSFDQKTETELATQMNNERVFQSLEPKY